MEFWRETSVDKCVVYGGEGFYMGWHCSITHGLSVDGVAIVVVEDKDVVVALAGGENETACLIRVGLAGNFMNSRKAAMGRFRVARWGGVWVVGFRKEGEWFLWLFSGLDTLACLLHVAFGSGNRMGRVFLDRGWGETGKVEDEIVVQGLGEGCDRGGEESRVGELD